jgi:hypothetical protein
MPSRAQKNRKYPAPPPTPEGMVIAHWGDFVPAWMLQQECAARMGGGEGVSFRAMDWGKDYDLADRLRAKRLRPSPPSPKHQTPDRKLPPGPATPRGNTRR